MNIAFQKSRAREKAKIRRAEIYARSAGAELVRHWPALEMRSKSVAGFWPIQNEIDVRPLMQALQDAGQQVALPRIMRKAHPLSFRAYHKDDELKRGPYGTAEPFISAPEITPQVVLLPLLAFNTKGQRLGYGGGYYDRTLAQLRRHGDVFACGVAFAGQETPDIPTDPYDQRLDGVLTEVGFRKF